MRGCIDKIGACQRQCVAGFFFLIIVGALSACGSSRAFKHTFTESGYCDPPIAYSDDASVERLPYISKGLDNGLLKTYSYRSLLVANACGILPDLENLQHGKPDTNQNAGALHKITMRLLLVSTEIASIAAELDCESERARQVADFVQEKENGRVRRLTVFSIVVGATAGVVNAAAPADQGAETIAIAGGVIGAAFGLSALLSGNRILFNHPRNLLADVWTEETTSSVYPAAVWFMLSERYFSNSQEFAIASNLKQRWMKFEDFDNDSKKGARLSKLFFGTGGLYSAGELHARVRMLNQIQAAVRLMNQDLLGLISEIARYSSDLSERRSIYPG